MVRIISIRVLFVLASIYKLYVHQINVKTTFLNEDLKEKMYMKQTKGFILPRNEKKICKLVKFLYGLKKAMKQWHEKFDKSIILNDFHHNSVNKCIYSQFTKDFGVIICLYVEYMLMFNIDMIGIIEIKRYFNFIFKMKDLGEVDTILGIKVKKHISGYAFNQS